MCRRTAAILLLVAGLPALPAGARAVKTDTEAKTGPAAVYGDLRRPPVPSRRP